MAPERKGNRRADLGEAVGELRDLPEPQIASTFPKYNLRFPGFVAFPCFPFIKSCANDKFVYICPCLTTDVVMILVPTVFIHVYPSYPTNELG